MPALMTHLLQLSAEKAAKARRMLDFMSLGGSLLILMQFCRMLSGTILACMSPEQSSAWHLT